MMNDIFIKDFGPMPSIFSGRGRVSKFYHLLIDFCVPLYYLTDNKPFNVYVPDHFRFNPGVYKRGNKHDMSEQAIYKIINTIFDGRLNIRINETNKQSDELWQWTEKFLKQPYPDYVDISEYGFDMQDQHAKLRMGVWSNYPSCYYDKIRSDMWRKFPIQHSRDHVTIIKRAKENGFYRPSEFNQLIPQIERHFKQQRKTVGVYDFSSTPFEQQIDICQKSDTIVGQHGAGLSNAIFMKPGGTLIEWSPVQFPCYKILATQAGLKYKLDKYT